MAANRVDTRILVHGDQIFSFWATQNPNDRVNSCFDRSVTCVSTVPREQVRRLRSSMLNASSPLTIPLGPSFEAAPAHVDQMLRELEMENCKAVKTPSETTFAAEAQAKLEAPTGSPDW